jgi:NADPH:quinone reductase-like Zn-dependent oxidoreductase
MKALFFARPTGPDNLVYGDLPEPQIEEPTDIIVQVRTTAMNRLDLFRKVGSHGSSPVTFPSVAGMEYAGEVVEVGAAVGRLQPGDRVLGTGQQTFAEYTRYKEPRDPRRQGNSLLKMPDWLTFEEAAAIPISFCMAWHMLHCTGRVQPGEDVLIMAAGSGTGSCGIQLAKAAGARVITTASSDEKLEKARQLGADAVINYRTQPEFAERVRTLTAGQGVDLVFEHVGAAVWEQCFASLQDGGRMVICGVTSGHRASIHLGQLWTRKLSILGCSNEPHKDLEPVLDLVEQRRVRGVVDSVFPMQEAEAAYRRIQSNDFFGKIILTVR